MSFSGTSYDAIELTPIAAYSQIFVKVFSPLQPFRSARQLVVLLCIYSYATVLSAQTLAIKMMDGRNGHPVANTYVNVWVGDGRKDALAIPTDKNGIARLRLTENDAEVNTDDRWKGRGESGVINPVVKYEDFVKVNVGYVVCEPHGTDFSWLEVKHFSTQQLLRQGVVTTNTCGKATASQKPGELIIFVRPLNFWEQLKQ